ncbi:RELT-like protein 1 [Rana temporaria]|uniref:RELT-like protein 1 n=1 Tax=Rana temporaria TaxID=8407 RepID=UPI001AACC76D|nr:RELT-like protein 1 [Rana temporaria]
MSPVLRSPVWLLSDHGRVARSADISPSLSPLVSATSSDTGSNSGGTSHPEYVAFILVPIFFITGLLGVLICHILMKKGYRCTTAEPEEEKISAEKIEMQDEAADTTNDTVGHIVSYIMKNEANADVLNAMVADNSALADNSVFDPETPTTPNTPVSPTSPNSPLGTPTKHSCHLHTIGGVADKNVCSRCAQKRWNPFKTPQKHKDSRKTRPSVTVLAVGRFRVTKVESKSKERKRLMSGTEASKDDVFATPVSVDTRQRNGPETENQSTVDT